MNKLLKRIDDFQYNHRPIGFTVAVIRRYSQNHAGTKAALITYYMFMSLFPLLFLLSWASNWLNRYDSGVSNSLIHGATAYFPVLGQQLYKIAHSAHRSLLGMIIPGLIAVYGARGAAMAFRSIVNDIWEVPLKERDNFPSSWLRAIGIVLLGGGGFIVTAVAESWALAHGHGNIFRAVITIISIALLAGVFLAILRLSLSKRVRVKKVMGGALSMALAFTLLQFVGAYLMTHDLRHYTNTYTALFSTTLGLLAWIYLVSQVLIYSLEITIVADRHHWPVRLEEHR